MPGLGNSGRFLRGGEFYSPVRSRLRAGGILLSELLQPCSRSVPRHEHELAYVTLVLRGDYLEGDRRLDEMRPLTAVFNPKGVTHSTLIGPAGASFFTVEFRPEASQDIDLALPQSTVFDCGAGWILWPVLGLYSAIKTGTADPLVIDGHVLELMGALSGLNSREKSVSLQPRWFARVKERLHEEFRSGVRMTDLARDAGVHPVHLARVFRRIERRTPGEYQHGLQVRAACDLLPDPDCSLAAVAAECGFADQSHFTRIFRRMTSTTPARFRQCVISSRRPLDRDHVPLSRVYCR